MKKFKSAFSLIEISIVILVIGLIVAGISQASRLVVKSAITSAQTLTNSSPVPLIDDLYIWLESTAEGSFVAAQAVDATDLESWFSINPTTTYVTLSSTVSPTYEEKVVNNLPIVRFASGDYFTIPSGNLPTGSEPYTAFFVANISAASCNCAILSSQDGDGNFFGFNGSGNFVNSWTNSSSTQTATSGTTVTAGKFYIFGARYAGGTSTSLIVSTDNTDTTGTVVATKTDSGANQVVGGNFDGTTLTSPFVGDLGEIIIYGRLLDSDEISDIRKYLSKKWKIPLS